MDGKGSLNPDAAGNLTHGKGLTLAFSLAPEDEALENLNPLLLTFANLDMNLQSVTSLKLGDIHPHTVLFDLCNCVHFITSPGKNLSAPVIRPES